jgi:hypothetical protein
MRVQICVRMLPDKKAVRDVTKGRSLMWGGTGGAVRGAMVLSSLLGYGLLYQ